jgi:DNA/RNA-binding domain of Phe-tRNA-synthetase-like protein
MTRIKRTTALWLFILTLLASPATGMAADFELFWDPNCAADAELQGYYIYYKQDASVVDDSSGAIDLFVGLNDIGFDPENPSFPVTGLNDDVRYCFAVTAWYGGAESGMSNEVCGVNGTYATDTDTKSDSGSDGEQQIVIIDDGDSGSLSSGTWGISGGLNPYGTQSLYSRDIGAQYAYETAITGRCEVALWWTQYASRCSAVPVQIYDGDVLVDTVTINQQQNGGQWNSIGAYDITSQVKVVVVSQENACSTCADAVKFTLSSSGDSDPDSDGDGISDSADAFPLDASEWSDADSDGIGDNADTDDDNDGMPDQWEASYGLDPFVDDAQYDMDGDGRTNISEYTSGTNPAATDSDGDGVSDSDDIFPLDSTEWGDVDGDGIGDNADTDDDNDGMNDEWEVLYGLNPEVNDALEDKDGDGISNIDEYTGGTDPTTIDSTDPTTGSTEDVIVIDDGEAGTSMTGSWFKSGGADPYGTQSLYSRGVGAEYSYESNLSGRYEVALWWTQYRSRCSAVPVEIYDGDTLIDTVTVNQLQDGGQWNVLGTYDFSGQAKVVVVSEQSECSTSADAAKFTLVDQQVTVSREQPTVTVTIDDGESGTSSTGSWYRSGGADPYGTQSLYSRVVGAEYRFEASLSGHYEVALWWTQYRSRCSAVPVEIYDGDTLIDTVTVNQLQDGGQWNVLGTYDFSGSASVKVISESGACSTCADAVQYQR